ncbi:MAG: methyltransferase domain-containing protein, partial [Desulfatiglandales bacterium]
ELHCKACKSAYPISHGVPVLLPSPKGFDRYENPSYIANYFYLHYADLLGQDARDILFYEGLVEGSDTFLEVGCGPGRLTLEMGRRFPLAVGIDYSFSFLKSALRLLRGKALRFGLPLEGELAIPISIAPPEDWQELSVEFIAADAHNLPFPKDTFGSIASINLIDRIRDPVAALKEMDRVLKEKGAHFLIADPFSWSEEFTPCSRWLGGRQRGPFRGRGIENLRRILEGDLNIFSPPLGSIISGEHTWTLRAHENRRELIRSLYLKAKR